MAKEQFNTNGPPHGGLPIFHPVDGRPQEIMNARRDTGSPVVFVLPETDDGTTGEEYCVDADDYEALIVAAQEA